MNRQIIVAEDQHDGLRADVFISQVMDISRAMAQKWLLLGAVCRQEKPLVARDKIKAHQEIIVDVPDPVPTSIIPQEVEFEILYEDDDLAVIYKPAGIVVHPAPGNHEGTLVHGLMYRLKGLSGIGGSFRPGIVHRLDKDTSGLMVIAKNDASHQNLSDQLKTRQMGRQYLALTVGHLAPDSGIIEAAIARHPKDRKRMAVVPTGRPATTEYRVIDKLNGCDFVALKLQTGRTHQIRVHMAHIHHGVLCDPVYHPSPKSTGQALHAWHLTFVHPKTKEICTFTKSPPASFLSLLENHGGKQWKSKLLLDTSCLPVL